MSACLGSLLGQAVDGFEVLLLVDDGSTDGSVALARGLQQSHPCGDRLRIIQRETSGGAQRARMDGLGESRGRIVVFTDADCEAPPGWLELVRRRLSDDIVALGGAVSDPGGATAGCSVRDPVVARLLVPPHGTPDRSRGYRLLCHLARVPDRGGDGERPSLCRHHLRGRYGDVHGAREARGRSSTTRTSSSTTTPAPPSAAIFPSSFVAGRAAHESR